jgi:hypothetical protein
VGGVLSVRGHFEDRGVEGNIILKCILLKLVGRVWNVFVWLRRRTVDGLL